MYIVNTVNCLLDNLLPLLTAYLISILHFLLTKSLILLRGAMSPHKKYVSLRIANDMSVKSFQKRIHFLIQGSTPFLLLPFLPLPTWNPL